jgi:hypothetical protein
MKTKLAILVSSLLLISSSICRADYYSALPNLGCKLTGTALDPSCCSNTTPSGDPVPTDLFDSGLVTVGNQTLIVNTASVGVAGLVIQPNVCQGMRICGVIGGCQPMYAMPTPTNGDPLEVVVKCFASKDGQDPLEIVKRALFKVNNVSCQPGTGPLGAGAGFTGDLKKAKEETITNYIPPALLGASISIDAGTGGLPGQALANPASIVVLTIHGSPGDTLHWSCEYSYSYFQAPHTQVDPRTCQPLSPIL